MSLFSEFTICESLISTKRKSYHLARTSRNHIQQHMEEQVYSTLSRQENINQITKVVNDDAISTKSSIRYSEERKREGMEVERRDMEVERRDMEGEKDMNRKCIKQNVVVNVMTKIIMVMKQVRFQVDDDKKYIVWTVFL